jgi:hypothetical protein
VNGSEDNRPTLDAPPPPPPITPPLVLPPSNPAPWAPQVSPPRPSVMGGRGPWRFTFEPRPGWERKLAIGCPAIFLSFVALIVIAIVVSPDAAVYAVGAPAALYTLALLVAGRAPRWVPIPGDVRESRSAAAVRWWAAGCVPWVVYWFAGPLVFLRQPPLAPLAPLALTMPLQWFVFGAVVAGSFAASWVAWRSVLANPSHPSHAVCRRYFFGDAPSSRVCMVAAWMSVLAVAATVGLFVLGPPAVLVSAAWGVAVIILGSVGVAREEPRPRTRDAGKIAILVGVISISFSLLGVATWTAGHGAGF